MITIAPKKLFPQAAVNLSVRVPEDERDKWRRYIEEHRGNFDRIQMNTDQDWKTAFSVMYNFFKDVIKNANIVLSEEDAQKKWNELWSQYQDKHALISELGRLVSNS